MLQELYQTTKPAIPSLLLHYSLRSTLDLPKILPPICFILHCHFPAATKETSGSVFFPNFLPLNSGLTDGRLPMNSAFRVTLGYSVEWGFLEVFSTFYLTQTLAILSLYKTQNRQTLTYYSHRCTNIMLVF